MGAQEQHDRLAVLGMSLDLGQRLEALVSEPFGEQRQVVGDRDALRELLVGVTRNRSIVSAPKRPPNSPASRSAATLRASCRSRLMPRSAAAVGNSGLSGLLCVAMACSLSCDAGAGSRSGSRN
jgi:hypothetical protein